MKAFYCFAFTLLFSFAGDVHAEESNSKKSGSATVDLFTAADSSRLQSQGTRPTARVPLPELPVSRPTAKTLGALETSGKVRFPLSDGRIVTGTVGKTEWQGGSLRVSGKLVGGGDGRFFFNAAGPRTEGKILLRDVKAAYELVNTGSSALLRQVPYGNVICDGIPRVRTVRASAQVNASAIPVLNTRPGATAQLYLDFDGEVVNDAHWGYIVAPAYNFTTAEITSIVKGVGEDFRPFNINVTTDPSKYKAAPQGSRMQCVITPNDEAAPGSGGVAMLSSFAYPFSAAPVCWVFNSSVKSVVEAASHEIGHTLGLHHDGSLTEGAYSHGHAGAGDTGWCPIMGAGYYQPVTQWSKGEYAGANNPEDDLAIISSTDNGFGYAADEAGNARTSAASLRFSAVGAVAQTGVITAGDTDYFVFTTTGGRISLNAVGTGADTDLDIVLQLRNASGQAVATSNPATLLTADLTATVAAGTYYLQVFGTGIGDVVNTGYSAYASMGAYTITGTIPGGASPSSASVADIQVTEGASGPVDAIFTVKLDKAVTKAASVAYAIQPGIDSPATAGVDYNNLSSGTLNFAAGESSKTLKVQVKHDMMDEPNETFQLVLSNPVNLTLVRGVCTCTIVDNDPVPSISIADLKVTEGNSGYTTANVIISLSNPRSEPITLNYETFSGTANAGEDYEGTDEWVTFAPGESSKVVPIKLIGDTRDEPDESFIIQLGYQNAGTVADDKAIVTIADDDLPPSISLDSPKFLESSGVCRFTATLSAASGKTVSVTYVTAVGTVRPATSGKDYTALKATILRFAPSETEKAIDVTVKDDVIDEANETLLLNLSAPVNVTIATASSRGIIEDDDEAPYLTVTSPRLTEANTGALPMTFKLTLSSASERTITLNYQTTAAPDSSATPGADYTALPLTALTFAPGSISASVAVQVKGDMLYEFEEHIRLKFSDAVNVNLNDLAVDGTIVDNDTRSRLKVGSASVKEDSATATVLSVPIMLSAPCGVPVVASYYTSGNSATAGTDFTALSGEVRFAAGQTAATVNVPIQSDLLDEDNETFELTVNGADNADIQTASAPQTIIDDDAMPSVSVKSLSVSEGNSGYKIVNFVLTLSAASGRRISLKTSTADGVTNPATDGYDYSGMPLQETSFEPGIKSITISIPVYADTLDEKGETFDLKLSAPVNVTLSNTSATCTILDDDLPPKLFISGVPISEGTGGTNLLPFTVNLSAPSGLPISVNYATVDGTALATADYTAKSGTLTIPAGQTSATINVAVVTDGMDETDETVKLQLSTPGNVTLPTTPSASGTIINDDSMPTLAVDTPKVTEGDSGSVDLLFGLQLSAASGRTITVPVSTAAADTCPAKVAVDYTALPVTVVTFAPGETRKSVTVKIWGDTMDEEDERVGLTFGTATNVVLSTSGTWGTIVDNDAVPALSVEDMSVTEGNTGARNYSFIVKSSAFSGKDIQFEYQTSNGSALDGQDYYGASSSLTLLAGQTSITVTGTLIVDTTYEADETFNVTLKNPVNATISRAVATGTIVNDDVTPKLSISAPAVYEGTGGTSVASINFTLAATCGLPVSINYATADGSALAGADYLAKTGTLTIPAGETTATVAVSLVTDSQDEPDEYFKFQISAPVNVTAPTTTSYTVGILNDDVAPSLSIANPSVVEGDDAEAVLTFKLKLSSPSGRTISVLAQTSSAPSTPATAGADYTTVPRTIINFAPGETEKVVPVTVLPDLTDEPNEEVGLTLSSPLNVSLDWSFVTGSIVDNDPIPTISIQNIVAPEGNSGTTNAVFMVSLSNPSSEPVSFYCATSNITARDGEDFNGVNDYATIPAGKTSVNLYVPICGDVEVEGNETFKLTLSSVTNATLPLTPAAICTIVNDESGVGS